MGAHDDLIRLAHGVLKPGFAGTRMPAWLAEAAEQGLTAVCYFGHNIATDEQTLALSAELHGAGIGLITTDEEGGIVSRLGTRNGSRHIGAAALGQADDLELTRLVAGRIGADLRSVGIDADLAPVADINSNPANPVIGVRSFGADPETVSRHAVAYAEGLAGQGVLACAKHFPGHGDTAVDSHVGVPRVEVSEEVLRGRELLPFAALVRAGVPMVMTGHMVVTALDGHRPATLSPRIIEILRDELEFEGVIASDALDMGAISDTVGLGRGCVEALRAGCDLLGLGNPVLGRTDGSDARIFEAACAAIVDAVRAGELPRARLAEAARRVAQLAEAPRRSAREEIGDDLVDLRAALASLRSRGIDPGMFSGRTLHVLDVRRQRNVAGGVLTSRIAERLVAGGGTLARAFEVARGVEGHATDVSALVARPPVGRPDVVLTGTPGLDPAEEEQLHAALERNPDAVVICMGYVPDDKRLPEVRRVVFTLGDSLPTARAVERLLR